MGNYLDQTWLAYASRGQAEPAQVEQGLQRVERHYEQLYPEPPRREACGDGALGMALWPRPNEHRRWPLWASADGVHVASTSPLTGWRGVVGEASIETAPDLLGREVLSHPSAAFQLNPPFVLAAHVQPFGLVIVNDAIGAGRLFELEWDGGWVWSNRLGALHVFAGLEPRADERAWGVLAATGWFVGELTAIEGARQLPPASVVEVDRTDDRAGVSHSRGMDQLHALVGPRRKRLRGSGRDAADGARELLRDVGEAWAEPLDVDLTGGRDSRVSAAAAIAVGADIEFRTADLEHGELDVVKALLEAAPSRVPSRVEDAEREPEDPLLERAGNLHLAHDGMRNPQSLLRAPLPIPQPPQRPSISGHGGELGHGFYYGSAKALERLHEGGRAALAERLVQAARKKRAPAQPHAYTAYTEEVRATLEEGRELGLEGPTLLDYYYLVQRLANRSGLTTRNDRWSACSTLAFVRACFDLTPEQRLESKMHRLVIGALVPQWKDVPFFEAEPAPLRETKQIRIWDKPGHSEALGRIIAEDPSWHGIFEADVVRAMWEEARAGQARNYFEPTFTRVVWRASFEEHLRTLATAATADTAS